MIVINKTLCQKPYIPHPNQSSHSHEEVPVIILFYFDPCRVKQLTQSSTAVSGRSEFKHLESNARNHSEQLHSKGSFLTIHLFYFYFKFLFTWTINLSTYCLLSSDFQSTQHPYSRCIMRGSFFFSFFSSCGK